MPFDMAEAVWRAFTWPISCPSNAASSASLSRFSRMARVQAMLPPGKA